MKLKFFPSCAQHPRTASFRLQVKNKAHHDVNEIYKTINSVYFDPVVDADDSVETPESWFTHSSESESSSESILLASESSDVEAVIRGAQQSANHQRLFFEPGPGESSSLMAMEAGGGHVTVAVDSEDPVNDFKTSMAEMVESLGVREDFEGLKELLGWFLEVNDRTNHGYIMAAFFDLVGSIFPDNNTTTNNNNDNDNNNNNNESSASFFSAAAASLSSSASARLFFREDSDRITR